MPSRSAAICAQKRITVSMHEKKRKEHLFLCSPNLYHRAQFFRFRVHIRLRNGGEEGPPNGFLADKSYRAAGMGALANPHCWNELFQNRMTHSLNLTKERFQASLRNCRNQLEQLQRSGSFSAFELGTGWFPTGPDRVLPLCRSGGLDLGYRA